MKIDITELETISIYRILSTRRVKPGDMFIYCGREEDGVAQSARALIRERFGVDYKLKQKKIIIMDPETAETNIGIIVKILEVNKEKGDDRDSKGRS